MPRQRNASNPARATRELGTVSERLFDLPGIERYRLSRILGRHSNTVGSHVNAGQPIKDVILCPVSRLLPEALRACDT